MTEFAEHLQNALGANYRLDRELTGGGMSRVFVAVDRVLGRNVVVKVLPPELAAGVNRDRFRREIQVAAQLQHPHIVPLLSAGEQGDLLWYTMPYIEGESLRAALERKKQFSAREVMRILHDIVDALAVCPRQGCHPSRYQAGQHPDAGLACAGGRLRRRQSAQRCDADQ